MRTSSFRVVEGYLPLPGCTLRSLRAQVWEFALDQRAFGPGKLLVAFADRDGVFHALAYTERTDPIDRSVTRLKKETGNVTKATAILRQNEPLPIYQNRPIHDTDASSKRVPHSSGAPGSAATSNWMALSRFLL